MTVQIQINGENASEAVRELTEFASFLTGKVEAAKPEKSTRSTRSTAAEPVKPDPVEPNKEESGSNPGDEEKGPVKAPSVVELRAKATEVGTSAEKKKAIKALLDEYGSKSISDVPEDQRADFMTALEAL